MLRCAKELGLKARVSTISWKRLQATPLPATLARRRHFAVRPERSS
jgi:subfamily B ATP-binding cassette protein HlyB/CyaB